MKTKNVILMASAASLFAVSGGAFAADGLAAGATNVAGIANTILGLAATLVAISGFVMAGNVGKKQYYREDVEVPFMNWGIALLMMAVGSGAAFATFSKETGLQEGAFKPLTLSQTINIETINVDQLTPMV